MLSYITGGKYAESLSDETARAFERLWTGKADAGVLKENGSGQKTLMEMSPEKQELIQRLSDKSLYQQDQEEKHLYIHPERIALARKNKREQAVHAKETDMARRLANHYGVDVFLLPPDVSEGNMLVLKGKNPDGIVNGVFFDAKQPISNSERSIQNNLRQGVKQGDLVYMDFSVAGTPMEDALRSIKGQIAMPEEDYEGKRLVLTNASGLFEEYMIRKKELVKSSFLGSPGLSPRSDSNIASNSESVKGTQFELADTPSMAEVRRKYEGTDQWMKAPNGEQTRLDERQWLQVRTPEFKRWFGDWEKAADYEWLMSSEPVTNLTGEELSTGMVEGANSFFETKYGGKVYRDGIGTIMLTRRGINSSIAHGVGRLKAAAFIAVPDVIAKGRVFGITENYKGRGYTSIVIDAPIRIGEKEYVCEVVVNKKGPSGVFYLHEVEVKEKLSVDNQVRAYNGQGQMRNANGKASRLIVSKLAAEGNFNSSKVLDENGEPMVVDGVFLSLDSDAVLRKIQARKLQAEVLAGRIRDAERDSGARYGTMDFAYANPEVSEDIALGPMTLDCLLKRYTKEMRRNLWWASVMETSPKQ